MKSRKPGPSNRGKALIIVPTYNERENVEAIYQKIVKATRGCDLLIIDDNSPDGTGDIADRLARKDHRVKVLHRSGKLGLGTACVAGFDYGLSRAYSILITMDADLSHDPAKIPQMLGLMKDYDMVVGSRYVKDGGMVNWGLKRLFISTTANEFLRFMLGIPQKDSTGGFKCYRAELLRKIKPGNFVSKGYVFYVEILYRALRSGARIQEIPIIFVNRDKGASKLNMKEVFGFLWSVVRLRILTILGKI